MDFVVQLRARSDVHTIHKRMAQCWLLSISQNGVAHPLARAPRFEPVAELNPSIDVWDRVQICGDLIAWSIIGESTDLTVYNWKTGREIWQDGYYVR